MSISFPLKRIHIKGNSMSPFLNDNDQIIILSFLWYKPKINDVVVVRLDKKSYLFCKRVKKIKGKEVWVEGDNSRDSFDSRSVGFISNQKIIGKMIFKL